MADEPPAASGQRSVTLDIGAIGSGLGDGIDIEEAYRLVAAAMENDAELMAAVGAARERAVETVRGNLAAKSARSRLEEYRRALDAEFEGTIDALTASMGMTASPDQKNTFNSAFDAFAADDERLRDLINGIGTSLRSGLPAGTRGRHAAHAKVALDEIDEPATADNIVEFKPRDAERERERSAAIDSRVPAVPPVRVAAAAGAACASAAAPVRNYSLNLR